MPCLKAILVFSHNLYTQSQASITACLCEITRMILSFTLLFKEIITLYSVSSSKAEENSSSKRTFPEASKARAMARRCICPPDRPSPCSLIRVSKPSGRPKTKSAPACSKAIIISLSVAAGFPSFKLSLMEPETSA